MRDTAPHITGSVVSCSTPTESERRIYFEYDAAFFFSPRSSTVVVAVVVHRSDYDHATTTDHDWEPSRICPPAWERTDLAEGPVSRNPTADYGTTADDDALESMVTAVWYGGAMTFDLEVETGSGRHQEMTGMRPSMP